MRNSFAVHEFWVVTARLMVQRLGLAFALRRCMSAETATFMHAACDSNEARQPRRIVLSTPSAGMLWCGGWLFTIGFAQLGFWKSVLALLIWPYFLGVLAR